jgi:hypothetical protein
MKRNWLRNRAGIESKNKKAASSRSGFFVPLSFRWSLPLSLLLSAVLFPLSVPQFAASPDIIQSPRSAGASTQQARSLHRAPLLGADFTFSSDPFVLIEGWRDPKKGEEMAQAFHRGGLTTLRFLFGGIYSPLGEEATQRVKVENHRTNTYPWFPLDDYVDFIARHDFSTVVGVNVEEGPAVAFDAVKKFIDKGLKSRIVAVELSNEPWLNERPWLPEEFASLSADIIDRLARLDVRFAIPLTVGGENKTPTRLTDDAWNRRMLESLSSRIDLKSRTDVYGVLHLYARGVSSDAVDKFNKAVRPFAPGMQYLVTEFNIKSNLSSNPQLTNAYAIEFARRLAELMARPEIAALYVHAVPYHSIMYWANGRRTATVYGQRDSRLTREDLARGWHLTPAGRVYELYSRLAWNGSIVSFRGGDQSYWTVVNDNGRTIVSLLNCTSRAIRKGISVGGMRLSLSAPPRSIVCFGSNGQEIERLVLPY